MAVDHHVTAKPDLTICDREPITRLDLIQPFGFLLALSNDWTVARASANIEHFLNVPTEQLIGKKLDRLISEDAAHEIRNRMAILYSTRSERLYKVKLLKGKKTTFDLALHFSGDLLVLEGEPSQPDGRMEAVSMVRAMIARLNAATSLDAFHRDAARQVRAITGFDRVMVYRFDANGAGQVIAESVKSGLESFLGLHYPASDIPVQARALYLVNPFRIIADVGSTPVSIEPPQGGAVQSLDLSGSVTRAVSPVHIEYLVNMGIGASLSVSIVAEGRLWGLVACHHTTARLPSFVMRTAAELFGQMYSLALETRLHLNAAVEERRTREISDRLITTIAGDDSLLANPEWLQDMTRDVIACDGVAIYRGGEVFATGATPPEQDVTLLAEALNVSSPSRVFATNHLASLHPPCEATADRAAGMLAIPISRVPRDYIMMFRREQIREIKWGGEPGKAVTPTEDGLRLSPRKSFAAFAELVRGHSILFSERDLRAGEAIRLALIEVILRFSESAGKERETATQRQDLLIAELNHRVRNILALIRGLITQTSRSAADVATYVDGLNGRVQSLARAHDLITRQNWGPGALAALFEHEIATYGTDGTGRFAIEGPAVLLQPPAFNTLALVIHELVTNSAKHGALSTIGTVYVTVEGDAETGVWLRWRERGGPAVKAPERRGFGSVIVERSVPFDLQGTAEVRYVLAGVEADFFIPPVHICFEAAPKTLETANAPSKVSGAVEPTAADGNSLAGLRILLVEDHMLIALEAEDMLNALGVASVILVSTLDGAAQALKEGVFDFAVLDISVGLGTSFDFAKRLQDRGVPYIFASGYGDRVALDREHSGAVVIQKPYGREHLRAAIQRVRGIDAAPAGCEQPSHGDAG